MWIWAVYPVGQYTHSEPYNVYDSWMPTITAGNYGPLQVVTDHAQYAPVASADICADDSNRSGWNSALHFRASGLAGHLAGNGGRFCPLTRTTIHRRCVIQLVSTSVTQWPTAVDIYRTEHYIHGSGDILDGTGMTIPAGDSVYFEVVAVPEPISGGNTGTRPGLALALR